jgi:hypothetical protein
MIASLADAWQWYEGVRELSFAMRRLGQKYWEHLPWDGPLGRDNRLRELTGEAIVNRAIFVLEDLDDLCVLLLFSVFEAIVRGHALAEVDKATPQVGHVLVQHALGELRDTIDHGAMFWVLTAYKAVDARLIEEVSQVRRYRNWVAHGCRGPSRARPTGRRARSP